MYNSWDCGGVFMVHTPNGVVEFKPNARWLHYDDMSADETIWYMLVTDGMTDHKDNEGEEDEVSKDFEQVGNQESEDTEGLNLKINWGEQEQWISVGEYGLRKLQRLQETQIQEGPGGEKAPRDDWESFQVRICGDGAQ